MSKDENVLRLGKNMVEIPVNNNTDADAVSGMPGVEDALKRINVAEWLGSEESLQAFESLPVLIQDALVETHLTYKDGFTPVPQGHNWIPRNRIRALEYTSNVEMTRILLARREPNGIVQAAREMLCQDLWFWQTPFVFQFVEEQYPNIVELLDPGLDKARRNFLKRK